MPRWVVKCPNCGSDFTHTQIELAVIEKRACATLTVYCQGPRCPRAVNLETVRIVKQPQFSSRLNFSTAQTRFQSFERKSGYRPKVAIQYVFATLASCSILNT
jgi:hypothetical protein